MPWRGPDHVGEFPTLGWLVGEWIEEYCVIPDGDRLGQPYLLTDEMWTFLAWHYRLRVDADQERWQSAWAYRRSQLVRPQKWGKGPLTSAMICAEAVGPVRFAGWDADGEPVGREWVTPWIQVTATSEDQTDNVYRALRPMIDEGPLADLIPDTGETRINVPGGGFVEPVTSSKNARLGQRITFAVQDETHCWVQANGGWAIADTQRRNLAGTGGRAVETTNGWDPSEQSVAQLTAESSVRDVHRDHRIPPPASIKNKAERRRSLRVAYGDSARRPGGWVDLDRIDGEIVELVDKGEIAQAERYFLNRIVAGSGAWMDGGRWDVRAEPREVPDGTRIVLGVDGSDVDDWTGIRAETLDGYQFTPLHGPDRLPTVWNPGDYDGQVPRLEVVAAWDELFERYDVVRAYMDPPYWESEIDAAADRHGDRVIRWYTHRVVQMHAAAERLLTDVVKTDTTFRHDGCPTAGAHVRNARKSARPAARYVLKKASTTQKIDLAVCSILAHEAAGDAIAAGLARVPKKSKVIVMR